jgi:hypothetical protein
VIVDSEFFLHLLILGSAIFNEPHILESQFPIPVCQIVQVKALGSVSEGQPDRYRLVLSDVQNFVQCMLATREYYPSDHLSVAPLTVLQRRTMSCMMASL